MPTLFETHCSLMTITTGRWTYAQRALATRDWVRTSCEQDVLPNWLTRLVVARVEGEIMAGMWPLLGSGDGAPAEEVSA